MVIYIAAYKYCYFWYISLIILPKSAETETCSSKTIKSSSTSSRSLVSE